MVALLLLTLAAPALAIPSARCATCLEGGDGSRGLLYRESPTDDLTLEWHGDWAGLDLDRVRLYVGNPSLAAALPDRGSFTPEQGRVRLTLPAAEVGQGTLVAVVVRESITGKPKEILSWEVFRLLDPQTHAAQLRGPGPHADWELDLTPAVLRATRAGQALPRAQGEEVVWWSLVDQPLGDLDLDGASTGLPGLSVTVSQPWLRRDQTWRDAVAEVLGGEDSREIAYGPLRWAEAGRHPGGRQRAPEGAVLLRGGHPAHQRGLPPL